MSSIPEGLDPEFLSAIESTRAVATQVREFYLVLTDLQFTPEQSMTLTCKWLESMMMAAAKATSR